MSDIEDEEQVEQVVVEEAEPEIEEERVVITNEIIASGLSNMKLTASKLILN